MTPWLHRVDDSGETLIELIIAIVIMGTTGIILASGLFTVALNSRLQEERSVAAALAAGAVESIRAAAFLPCATPQDYLASAGEIAPSGYTIDVTSVDGWSGTRFSTASTTLAAGLAPDQTVLQVSNPDALGAAGPMQLAVMTPTPELVSVTAGFGTAVLTIQRGATRVAHASGAEVRRCDRLQRVKVQVSGPDNVTVSVIVAKPGPLAPTTVSASAPPTSAVGATTLSDTVQIEGGLAPTGIVTVDLYAPAQFDPATETCIDPPLATATTIVAGNGSYSVTLSPTDGFDAVGTYRWVADYSGDPANRMSTGICDADGQRTVVGGG